MEMTESKRIVGESRKLALPRTPPWLRELFAASLIGFVITVRWQWNLVGRPVVAQAQEVLRHHALQRRFARLTRRDPAVGTKLTLPSDLPVGANASCILLFTEPFGGCCSRQSVETGRALKKQFGQTTPVVLIADPSWKPVQATMKTKEGLPVIIDDCGDLARTFNTFWTPRAYVLRKERLAWIQKGPQTSTDQLCVALDKFIQGEQQT